MHAAKMEAAADPKQLKLTIMLGVLGDAHNDAIPLSSPTAGLRSRESVAAISSVESGSAYESRGQGVLSAGGTDFVEQSTQDRLAVASDETGRAIRIQKRHPRYTAVQKQTLKDVLYSNRGNKKKTARIVRTVMGYEKIGSQHFRYWEKQRDTGKVLGRPVNAAFEASVIDRVVFHATAGATTEEDIGNVANVAFSYDIIREAAHLVMETPQFQADPLVSKLKFTDKWVSGVLRRARLHRRRVTSAEKVRPSIVEVRKRMGEIQDVIASEDFEDRDIISADETGIFFGMRPRYQYVEEGIGHVAVPESNEKARITVMLWSTGEGELGPPFIIVRNSTAGADQSASTVLDGDHLMAETGFQESDGWQIATWSKTLTLRLGGKDVTATYKRRYITNPGTRAVVTCNPKAWMDSVCMVMWAELQLAPWASGRRKLLVMDNCAAHRVPAVKAAFEALGLVIESLPPNMTDRLQVIDIAVNGPIKAAIRRARCMGMFQYFQDWKARRGVELQKPELERTMPSFSPPAPTVSDGIKAVLAATAAKSEDEDFQDGVHRTFVNVGLLPDPKLNVFLQYAGAETRVPRSLVPQDENELAIADLACPIELEERPLADDNLNEPFIDLAER